MCKGSDVYVYIALIPESDRADNVYPSARAQEIESVSNKRVKREKYYVWKLLEYALANSLGLDIKKMEFKKTDAGKWESPSCEFSLSHTHGAVAVAVSEAPVGIDIERARAARSEKMADRILTKAERVIYSSYMEKEKKEIYLIKKWTEKEAVFKLKGDALFKPSSIESGDYAIKIYEPSIEDKEFICALATFEPADVKVFSGIEL